METTRAILEAHPRAAPVDRVLLADALNACLHCMVACVSCADAVLAEEGVRGLRRCARLNLDCADVCVTTIGVLARQTEFDHGIARAALAMCSRACSSCAQECERHVSSHAHCRLCARACRIAEQKCEDLLVTIA